MKIKSILFTSFLFFISFLSYSQSLSWVLSANLHATTYQFLTYNDKVLAATAAGVYYSTDDGITWSACGDTMPYASSITVDSSGWYYIGGKDGVYRSKDEGATWQNVLSTIIIYPDSSRYISAIWAVLCSKTNIILAATDYVGVYRSIDQGDTWTKSSSNSINQYVYSLAQSNSGIIYAGTKNGVYRSYNSGSTWNNYSPVYDFTYALTCGDDKEVFAGFSYTDTESGVYHSTNSGNNWFKFGLQNLVPVGLAYDKKNVLLAAVEADWNNANVGLYMTYVDSVKWIHFGDNLKNVACRSVYILPSDYALVGTSGGSIYRSQSILPNKLTSVDNSLIEIKSFSLSQNYPNPFNPSTVINYSLPKLSFVNVTIYNAIGMEVTQLVNKQQNAGEYSVTWQPPNLPSGIYFYKIVAGDFVQTRKMILLK